MLAAGVLAAGMSACGGGGHPANPRAVVKQTFASHTPVQSGRLNLLFTLRTARLRGSRIHAEALLLQLTGPFQSLGASRLPRFALAVQQRSSGPPSHTLRASVTSTGTQLFIGFRGRQFLASPATAHALQQAYAQASGRSVPAQGSSLATLGLDPEAWLTHPRIAGSRRIGGVQSTHITAALNVSRFLADASVLSAATAPLQLGAGTPGAGPLPPALAVVPADAVRVARVDLFTGAQDHLPRRLAVRLGVVATPRMRAALGGVRRVTLTLVLGLSEENKPQRIVAPPHPRPLSELAPLLSAHS